MGRGFGGGVRFACGQVDKCRHRGAGCAATWTAVIGAGERGQAVVGAWSGDAARDAAGAGSQNGEPEGRFGVQQGVFQRPPAPVAGPCRAAVSACSAPAGQDAGLRCGAGAAAAGYVGPSRSRECVSARERRPCAAWKLTHPGGRGDNRRRAVVSDGAGDRLPQSRPYPRGGSMLSSSARSSPQIASSFCASADSWRASGRLSSHA